MNVIVAVSILVVGLFLAAYMTKRRFGLLGLGLAAGSVLSSIWGYDAGLLVNSFGIRLPMPVINALTMAAITLLPAIVLLFHGQSYRSVWARLIGSAFFAVLAAALLVEPLGHILVLEGLGANVFSWLQNYSDVIVGVGLVVAVIDLMFTKPPKHDLPGGKH